MRTGRFILLLMNRRVRAWLGYSALWTLLGLVFATQLFLAEPVTPARWTGIGFIVAGVFLVSRT